TPEGETYIVKINPETNSDKLFLSNSAGKANLYMIKQKDNGKSYTNLKIADSNYHVDFYYTPGLSYDVDVFDVVNENLADSTAAANLFGSVHDAVSHTGVITLYNGLDDEDLTLNTDQLYMNVIITVTDPTDSKEPNKVLSVVKGTVFK
nr:hypothetical protein [Lachnospiraceae bacterium]